MKKIILIFLVLFLIYILKRKNIEKFSNFNDTINIVISCDKNQFDGLIALVNSILLHTKQRFRLFFNFLVDKNEKEILDKLLKEKLNLQNYYIKEIEEDKDLTNNVKIYQDNNIKNIMNFARFNFVNEFDYLDKILYLDADMIVKAPIENLYDESKKYSKPHIAAESSKKIGNCEIKKKAIEKLKLNKDKPHFNAGMYITSLEFWRKNNLKKKCLDLMKLHKNTKGGLFYLGTQPILNIIFHEELDVVDNSWNTEGLGDRKVNLKKIKNAKILHWTGKQKPWLPNGRYKKLWRKYKL
jgi:lipopolysaccharide biosynthesis glycosyltransferase